MRQFLESFSAAVETTGGLALLVAFPLIPILLLFGGLQAAGRGIWSRGTESNDVRWAKEVLTYETDPMIVGIARNILDHCES